MNLKILMIFIVCIIFITIITGSFNTIYHEDAHKEINRHYGCEGSSISYGLMIASTTGINCDANHSVERESLHTLNEIVGYNVTSIIITLILCTLVIGIVIILCNRDEKK
jgi:hypothetical protein